MLCSVVVSSNHFRPAKILTRLPQITYLYTLYSILSCDKIPKVHVQKTVHVLFKRLCGPGLSNLLDRCA